MTEIRQGNCIVYVPYSVKDPFEEEDRRKWTKEEIEWALKEQMIDACLKNNGLFSIYEYIKWFDKDRENLDSYKDLYFDVEDVNKLEDAFEFEKAMSDKGELYLAIEPKKHPYSEMQIRFQRGEFDA